MSEAEVIAWRRDPVTWDTGRTLWTASLTENTRRVYLTGLEQFIQHRLADATATVERWGACEPWRISTGDVRAWQRALTAQGLSPATVNNRVAALSSLFGFCQREMVYTDQALGIQQPLATVNPCDALKRLDNAHKAKVALTGEQARALLDAADRRSVNGSRNYALLLGYLLSGNRNSEIRLLRWGDLHVEGDGDDALVFFTWRGKGGTGGEEILHPAVYHAITAYLRGAGRLETIQPEDYVFTALQDVAVRLPNVQAHANGQAITRQRVNDIVKSLARRAGLRAELITTHTLRRTVARRFYEASGHDLDLTQKILHHASPNTTRDYLHQPELQTREIWEKVAALYGL